eukprot:1990181-Pleurochrysis_carterae.AAC.2
MASALLSEPHDAEVCVHGIIGQSFLATPARPKSGRHDQYPGGEASTKEVLDHILGHREENKSPPSIREFTTSAMAEGTQFKFSCFARKAM